MTLRRTHFVVLILCIFFCGVGLRAAFAGRREKTEGSLEKGKLADLIIVSQNIFEIDPHKISETKVRTTIVGGQVIYQSNAK
jgi:predicted amidohydrolase YtcJ